jgi:hypothetical protein
MKNIPFIIFFLLTNSFLHAQPEPARKAFSFGPVIGLGHAWMTPVAYSEYNPTLNAGVFGIYSPLERWGLGMDLRYSVEGPKKYYSEGGVVNEQFHYLRIPIRGIFFFGNTGDDFRPKIAAGPSMGFLVKHTGPVYTSENHFDFGATVSAGFNYRLYRSTWFNADLSYYHGFTDAIMHTENRELQRNITLNVGVGFEL